MVICDIEGNIEGNIWGIYFYKCKCSNYDLQETDVLTLKEIRKEKIKTL